MPPLAVTALPDFDSLEKTLTSASQSLGTLHHQHRRGLIAEHELAERSYAIILTAIENLTRILRMMEGLVPEHPWPLGTALSVPHHGIGLVVADNGTECSVRCADRDVTVPADACEWAWHPTPATQSLAQEAVWPPDPPQSFQRPRRSAYRHHSAVFATRCPVPPGALTPRLPITTRIDAP